jgi:hypothetical protein
MTVYYGIYVIPTTQFLTVTKGRVATHGASVHDNCEVNDARTIYLVRIARRALTIQ